MHNIWTCSSVPIINLQDRVLLFWNCNIVLEKQDHMVQNFKLMLFDNFAPKTLATMDVLRATYKDEENDEDEAPPITTTTTANEAPISIAIGGGGTNTINWCFSIWDFLESSCFNLYLTKLLPFVIGLQQKARRMICRHWLPKRIGVGWQRGWGGVGWIKTAKTCGSWWTICIAGLS